MSPTEIAASTPGQTKSSPEPTHAVPQSSENGGQGKSSAAESATTWWPAWWPAWLSSQAGQKHPRNEQPPTPESKSPAGAKGGSSVFTATGQAASATDPQHPEHQCSKAGSGDSASNRGQAGKLAHEIRASIDAAVEPYQHLCELRQGFLKLVDEKYWHPFDSDEEHPAVAIATRTWQALAVQPCGRHVLPPMYPSAQLQQQWTAIWCHLFHQEQGKYESQNHPIYYGCKGVGKSTLLKAVHECAVVLLRRVVPLYRTFEGGAPPVHFDDLLDDIAREACVEPVPESERASKLEMLIYWGTYPCILLDEFTQLYRPQATGDLAEQCVRLMRTVQWAGKERNVVLALAASTYSIGQYMHPEGTEFGRYPKLNSTVFVPSQVLPVARANLGAYISTRYPGVSLSDELLDCQDDLDSIWRATG